MPDSLNNISIEIAESHILPLVKRFFQHNSMRAQAAKSDSIYIARDNSKSNKPIIAALRLCPTGQYWLLRSMCVDPAYQHQGIGKFMLAEIKSALNEKQCFCFAYSHLEHFYSSSGFSVVDITQVPSIIADKFRQYSSASKDIILMQFTTR